jgi:hypothetical protein
MLAGAGSARRTPRSRWAVIALVVLGLSGPAREAADLEAPALGVFQRGMALGVFSRGSEEDLRPQVRELARLGFDSVSLVVPKVLRNIHALDFYSEPTVTPSDEALRRATRLAHAAGLRVFLFPIIYVWELKEGEWRGTLAPPEWGAWFQRYGDVILHYAALAREEGVEYFSVGSELCSSETHEAEWRDLIARVRRIYPGALTYSANWDHRDVARFLDAVDFLGMNAYFRLTEEPHPSLVRLEESWKPIVREVEAWATGLGKPLVITEVGYPSREGAARDPWDYTVEARPEPEEQATLYRAFLRSWTRARSLAGVYFYLWWGEGGALDTGYTPRGKAAEEVLRAWLQNAPLGMEECRP